MGHLGQAEAILWYPHKLVRGTMRGLKVAEDAQQGQRRD
jgi:hypothetical protein